ncbi:MAG: DUF2017 domain-containing protein [Saccharopolyspora sp.]|uniref:DUF2017 domain-containing protein n=1 Tax=Saccharopolyspora TaxID=1835 RepID=UPI00190D4160|nr:MULTISPECIES: DUF2017 domain-containing protein [unclassified Saccharopolyspora]MBK0870023.1 DUF2017 domain-containing protein [Saccharopolyspora sp. HNM0986]MBQ6642025.1 DUF2017 domain-containing protein [Saccharopolyspora sp.]
MNGWTRKNGHVVAELSQQEAAVIRGLVGQIKDMLDARADEAPQDELAELTGIRTGPSTPPEDRVLERLLPDFYRRDPETGETDEEKPAAAGAMRSLYEPELLDRKTGTAAVVLETCPRDGGRVVLSGEQADNWLSAINDVRLALGTALDVQEDMPEEPPEDDLRREHLGVYQWLTWVQDSLVETLTS